MGSCFLLYCLVYKMNFEIGRMIDDIYTVNFNKYKQHLINDYTLVGPISFRKLAVCI